MDPNSLEPVTQVPGRATEWIESTQGNQMRKTTGTRRFGWTLGVLIGFGGAGHALAQAGGGLVLDNAVYQDIRVTDAAGKVTTKRVPAKSAVPGGEVVYEIAYHNTGKAPATDVAINTPVAPELVFVSTEGAPVTAVSVDGGRTFGKLSELKVTGDDGKVRAAVSADVTNLRWIVAKVEPGSKGKVSYHARVR